MGSRGSGEEERDLGEVKDLLKQLMADVKLFEQRQSFQSDW